MHKEYSEGIFFTMEVLEHELINFTNNWVKSCYSATQKSKQKQSNFTKNQQQNWTFSLTLQIRICSTWLHLLYLN